MITVDQIRAELQRVVLSEISLDDFDEWLTKASWNMQQDSAPGAVNLVGKIELLLADYDSERVSHPSLITALHELETEDEPRAARPLPFRRAAPESARRSREA
jgi:hypothetical protein